MHELGPLRNLITGDVDQDADTVNSLLQDIAGLSESYPQLFSLISYNVKQKGQNERSRYARIFSYAGPDINTIDVVQQNHLSWKAYPTGFWRKPLGADLRKLSPEAQVVGYFLQTGLDDA